LSRDNGTAQAPSDPGRGGLADGELQFVLKNDKNAMENGCVILARHLSPRAYNARVLNRLEVIFEELVSNIIRYGFSTGSRQSICVTVAEEPGVITLTFEDDGIPFDPLQAPAPEPFTSIENAKIGGQGIALIRKFSTSLCYEKLARRHDDPNLFSPCNRTIVRIAT
jgi:anti-sigma regulatory factor (Ser/Thr protein kinase)